MAFTGTVTGSSAGGHHEADDISVFLRQLLHRASSSSSSSSPPSSLPSSLGTHAPHQQLPCFSSLPISNSPTLPQQIPTPSTFLSGSDRIVVNRNSNDPLTMPSPPAYLPGYGGLNLSSESLARSVPIRSVDNDDCGEDCDCESEEAAEALQPPPRNHSKRSRAAEVHNLSEKRRRSRINEKMKALQNLIPNSNKTDKASMLDEAIEYLKQLQLQVQMLSVRNGLSLHPMCLPGVSGILHPTEVSQVGLDFSNRGTSLDANMPNEVIRMPATSHALFNSAKQCLSSTGPSLPTVSSSEPPSFGLDSYIQDNFAPFQLRNYPQPQAVCRDQNVAHGQIVVDTTQSKSRDVKEESQQRYGLHEILP